MSISVEYRFIDEILTATCTGEYSLDSAKNKFIELLKHLKINNAKKVLIDCRQLKNIKLSTMGSYDYAKFVADETFNQGLFPKLAYLYLPSQIDDFRQFAEDVAVNRGVCAQVFYNYNKAIQWLNTN